MLTRRSFLRKGVTLSALALPAAGVLAGDSRGIIARPVPTDLEVRLIVKKSRYVLDLGGKTPEEFEQQIRNAEKRVMKLTGKGEFPPLQPVDLMLELKNVSDREIALKVGGSNGDRLDLELKGPGAISAVAVVAFLEIFIPSLDVPLAPGESHLMPITGFVYGHQGVEMRAYWTKPGAYTLQASYTMDRGQRAKSPTYTSQPVKLEVLAKGFKPPQSKLPADK